MKKDMKKKSRCYEVKVRCENCKGYSIISIPWGTTAEAFLKKYPDQLCLKCGCWNLGETWLSYSKEEEEADAALEQAKKWLEGGEEK